MRSADARPRAWPGDGPHPGLLLAGVATSAVVGALVARSPSLAAAGVVAVAGGLVVLRRPEFGGWILVGVVPVTSGLRSGLPIPQVRLSEALIAGIGVPALVTAAHRRGRWSSFDSFALLWAAAWSVTGFADAAQLRAAVSLRSMEALVGPFQFLLLYRGVAVTLTTARLRRVALAIVMWGSVPVSLLAVAQGLRLASVTGFVTYLTGGDVFHTYAYQYFARATGPFNHWTPLAGYLLVILVVGIALLLRRAEPMPGRTLRAILLLDAMALLLSAELSAIGGLLAAAAVLGVRAGRGRDVARWLGLGAAAVIAAFGSYFVHRLHTEFGTAIGSARNPWVPQTIAYRWHVWTTQYFPAIGSRLTTGWGPVLPKSISWPFTESQYVTLLMEGGLVVLAAYGAMMAALRGLCRRAAQLAPPSPADRATAEALGTLVLVVALISVVFPYFTAGGLPEPFCVAAGLVVSAAADHSGARRRRGHPARRLALAGTPAATS